MRLQRPSAAPTRLVDEDSKQSALSGSSIRELIKPRPCSHPLLSPLLSLLSTLAIPLRLSSLTSATPTLLLTVLEALLETRLVEVENTWRGSWVQEDRRRLLLVLLEATTQVWEVVRRRRGECEDGWMWREDEVDVDKVVQGDEEEVAKIVEALLRIAETLRMVKERGGPSKPARRSELKTDGRKNSTLDPPRPVTLPSDPADVFHDSRARTTATGLFANRTLRPQPTAALPPNCPPPPLDASSAGHRAVAPLSQFARPARPTNSSTPPHPTSPADLPPASRYPSRHTPKSSPSFLATLSDPSSRLVDEWREKQPVPPLSPRKKAAAARMGDSRVWSVKDALERQAEERRVRELKGQSAGRRKQEEEDHEGRTEMEGDKPVEPDSKAEGRPTTPRPPLKPRPPRTPKSRSPPSPAASEQDLSDQSCPPCTCSASPLRPVRHASTSPPPRARRVTTATPSSPQVRRVRVTRLPPRAPLDTEIDEGAYLSVHSSTDLERDPQAPSPTLSLSLSSPSSAKPPAPSPQLCPPDSRSPTQPPPPSPYTIALLAKRDALKAKLTVLERREADRRLLVGEG